MFITLTFAEADGSGGKKFTDRCINTADIRSFAEAQIIDEIGVEFTGTRIEWMSNVRAKSSVTAHANQIAEALGARNLTS